MAKLTDAQLRALREISQMDGKLTAWCVGTTTCNGLLKRGLVSGHGGDDRPFKTGWRDNGYVYITPAGRAALEASHD